MSSRAKKRRERSLARDAAERLRALSEPEPYRVTGVDWGLGPSRTVTFTFKLDLGPTLRVFKEIGEAFAELGRATLRVARQRVDGVLLVLRRQAARRPWDRALARDRRPVLERRPPGSVDLRAQGPFWLPRGGCGRRPCGRVG